MCGRVYVYMTVVRQKPARPASRPITGHENVLQEYEQKQKHRQQQVLVLVIRNSKLQG